VLLFKLQGQLLQSQQLRYQSYLVADELRQSSEDLTKLARNYVVTSDPRYEKSYEEVLNIRDGKQPRVDGRAISLRKLMEELGFTTAELDKLTTAEAESNALVKIEQVAMNAVKGIFDDGSGHFTKQGEPDLALARRIMFDDNYYQHQTAIMKLIEEFSTLLDKRTKTAVTKLSQQSFFYLSTIISLIIALITIAIIFYYTVKIKILKPLGGEPLVMVRIAQMISRGDLTVPFDVINKRVTGLYAELQKMVINLNALIKQIQQTGIQVNSSATELAATAKQQKVTMLNQVDFSEQVKESVKQISEVITKLVQTMQQVAIQSAEATEFATHSQIDLSRMESTMRNMENASKSISCRLSAINEKMENITTVVTTITKVADQTNLLSLNAAIEAEKAGEYGRGFNVVAREIRRLADQTAVATLDIEQMVKEMQAAVTTGVMEMDKFISEVKLSAEDVNKINGQMNQIIEQVQALSPQFEEINIAMSNQSQNTQKINHAIQEMSEGMRQTAEALDESFQALEQLNEAASSLQTEISCFKVN
jgi:methyl-accepting chemotaxis protein WspA